MNAPSEPEFLFRYRHLQGAHREYTFRRLGDRASATTSPAWSVPLLSIRAM